MRSWVTTRRKSMRASVQLRSITVSVCLGCALASSILSAFVGRCSRREQSGRRLFSLQQNQQYLSDDRFRPMPTKPSDLFISLAESQMELLESSLPSREDKSKSKVSSMALYFPRENARTGQLEFFPMIQYPRPMSRARIFVATDDGLPTPTFPRSFTALPGFTHASSVLPDYPMMMPGESARVGTVEEVMCDPGTRSAVLSVPLLSGPQTVGALLVWPTEAGWTFSEKDQVSRAAQSMALALSMDMDRIMLRKQAEDISVALSDSLHQIKNPLQALRMYGKLLQRQVNSDATGNGKSNYVELAQQLLVQSERVVDLLSPMDSIVHALDLQHRPPLALNPSQQQPFPEHLSMNPIPKEGTNTSLSFDVSTTEPERREPPEPASVPNLMVFGEGFGALNATDSSVSTNTGAVEPSHNGITGAYEFGQAPPPKQGQFPFTVSGVGDSELQMSFVSDVLGPILHSCDVLGREKGINVVIEMNGDDLPGVMISPRSLQEAVSNVLDNALKYVVLAPSNSSLTRNPSPIVRVVVEPNADDDRDGVTIWIKDNGPGVTLSDRENIFERGYRSEQTRHRVPGTGIGLDISQNLVARMGGDLELLESHGEGPQGTGAAFRFKLYRKPTE